MRNREIEEILIEWRLALYGEPAERVVHLERRNQLLDAAISAQRDLKLTRIELLAVLEKRFDEHCCAHLRAAVPTMPPKA